MYLAGHTDPLQADGFAGLVDAVWHLRPRHPPVLKAERDVVVHLPQHDLRVRVLEEVANTACQVTGRGRRSRQATYPDVASLPVDVDRVGHQSVQAERQRALPGTARPNHEQALARRHRKGDAVEAAPPPAEVADRQPIDREGRRRRSPPLPSERRGAREVWTVAASWVPVAHAAA
jgi:hypothetical protein